MIYSSSPTVNHTVLTATFPGFYAFYLKTGIYGGGLVKINNDDTYNRIFDVFVQDGVGNASVNAVRWLNAGDVVYLHMYADPSTVEMHASRVGSDEL